MICLAILIELLKFVNCDRHSDRALERAVLAECHVMDSF